MRAQIVAQVETQLVPVLPRVAGYVKTIAVNDYDSVKANQLVVELDDADIQAQLLQMNADYAAAVADLENAKASLNNALVSLRVNKGNISINQVKLEKVAEKTCSVIKTSTQKMPSLTSSLKTVSMIIKRW